eukprot:CAMPEP_0116153394 /NCGR_PEP_ID=MMETSP0329-20121206/21222_1 /TAXON_ID=697910 /ORGANISM="Pseudo-nitzschia arenysensis, Strain B593" /LENGTH=750 /DNA_ID=CAMNT_0003650301 /DNA_START=51 /DNA_END=2303 /DNA_ORIENTATION=-
MADIERQETAPEPTTERSLDRKVSDIVDPDDATWGEVVRTCCYHSPIEWAGIFCHLLLAAFFLYFFILGLEILGDGAQVLTGCAAGALFGDDMNPVSGLMIGIICTVFLQSSSTTTSIVVTLVGAGAISVNQGIYMVMGSNIGTTVTNTIVAMGQMGDGDQLERAFAGATVHDMFNILTVTVLFPIELTTGYLNHLTEAIIPNASTSKGSKHKGILKTIVAPLAETLIIVNKKVTQSVAQGGSCDEFYPTVCDDPENPTKDTCSTIGLIGCPKDGDLPCPALFEPGATRNDDKVAGLTAFSLGIVILFVCLYGLVTVLQKLLLGASERIIYKATNINGYLAMIIGALITMGVQSSSIFTATLTPLVGLGLIRLEQMLPLTLGSNVGTCVTSLLAAFVTEGTDALQVALAHLFFNITGILIWYPLPFLRSIPLDLARKMGKATRLWKGFPVVYILVIFLAIPLALLGISNLFGRNQTLTAIGSLVVVLIVVTIIISLYWLYWKGGRKILAAYLKQRQQNTNAMETLHYDMHYVERRIEELQRHTACPSSTSQVTITSNPAKENNLTNVALDMEHALEKVELIARHTGLPLEEDLENLKRLWHKEKESMDDIDIPGLKGNQIQLDKMAIISRVVGLCVLGMLVWGLVVLFSNGSTGYTAMGGLIVSLLVYFLTLLVYYLIYHIVTEVSASNGNTDREALYKDNKLRQMYRLNYSSKMAQIETDLRQLESHTGLEAIYAENETTTKDSNSVED